MSTFLKLELAGRDNDPVLLNVDHIVRIHPTWPQGCTIVTTDDTSLHVRPSMDKIYARLTATNGRTTMLKVEHDILDEVRLGAVAPQVDEAYEAMCADMRPEFHACPVERIGDCEICATRIP